MFGGHWVLYYSTESPAPKAPHGGWIARIVNRSWIARLTNRTWIIEVSKGCD